MRLTTATMLKSHRIWHSDSILGKLPTQQHVVSCFLLIREKWVSSGWSFLLSGLWIKYKYPWCIDLQVQFVLKEFFLNFPWITVRASDKVRWNINSIKVNNWSVTVSAKTMAISKKKKMSHGKKYCRIVTIWRWFHFQLVAKYWCYLCPRLDY